MFPQFLRDIQQEFLGQKPGQTLAWFVPAFALAVTLMTFISLVSLAGRSAPIKPPPRVLPVTAFVAEATPSPEILPVAATRTAPVSELIEYRVKSGDTFGALGRQYCFDYNVVARENGITDPNWIYAGKTILKFKNGCARNTPQVLANRNVSPGEFASDGGASREKQIPILKTRDTEATLASPLPASAPVASVPPPDVTRPLSEIRHREIYRKAALLSIRPEERTKAQNAELYRLTMRIRPEVLARYKLANPGCLYANEAEAGQTASERTLYRARCIRENYGSVIDEVAAEHRLPAAYLEAIILIESGGKPDAISPTGCTGVKQFCLGSARRFGLQDRFDPFESIRAGGRHLGDNLRHWQGNIAKATAHYNVGSVIVGTASFNAAKFPYTQHVLRVQRLIEKETQRTVGSEPTVVPVSYTPARKGKS